MIVRAFREEGLEWFAEELARCRETPEHRPDPAALNDDGLTERVLPKVEVEFHTVKSKREAAIYLSQRLAPLGWGRLHDDVGVWAWLSLGFFDSICPLSGGKRKVLADAHYIPEQDSRRSYRHLLRTPVRVLREVPAHNGLFLDSPIESHGDIMEQLMGRLFLMRYPAVAEAAERMYFDPVRRKPKRGIVPKSPHAGDLRSRFPARVRQLQLTYDIASLSGTQLLPLLGDEFAKWFE